MLRPVVGRLYTLQEEHHVGVGLACVSPGGEGEEAASILSEMRWQRRRWSASNNNWRQWRWWRRWLPCGSWPVRCGASGWKESGHRPSRRQHVSSGLDNVETEGGEREVVSLTRGIDQILFVFKDQNALTYGFHTDSATTSAKTESNTTLGLNVTRFCMLRDVLYLVVKGPNFKLGDKLRDLK